MIHRDLKPSNVIVNLLGQPVLLDFGIAKIVGGDVHTATGATVGTAAYMAPEQVSGESIDHRADIYSLGIMLYEMACGRAPYDGSSPADATAEEILGHKPDGVFLSNGPGDPAATGVYAVPAVQKVLETGLPVFGICLGHQILALALGAKTTKMQRGHRGANHPVKDLTTGKVEITSQNHGFMVDTATLPAGVVESHVSLFDGTNEGIAVTGRPVFSVQYHPEASPGPKDSHYLFERFVSLIETHKGIENHKGTEQHKAHAAPNA
jgi:serine/threonine protein kinase